MKTNTIINGDCIEEMKKFPDNSVDAIITDPPYGLEFMGKDWDKFGISEGRARRLQAIDSKGSGDRFFDYRDGVACRGRYSEMNNKEKSSFQNFIFEFSKEAIRVLKPGGHLLAFGGTRTYHRLTCAIEDAGFEIRDCIMWIYGSGFPKSLNIGKQIDKMQGNERKVIGISKNEKDFRDVGQKVKEIEGIDKLSFGLIENAERKSLEITQGDSEWEGWGTALKPAVEPIVVARKPLSEKTVAENVLKWGTGGINIDENRIKHSEPEKFTNRHSRTEHNIFSDDTCGFKKEVNHIASASQQGRFPANIILDEEAGQMLDEQTGLVGNGHWSKTTTKGFGEFGGGSSTYEGVGIKDKEKGGASRFFYCAKASKSERDSGIFKSFGEERETPMAGRGQGGLKCKICNKWKNSGSPCICKEPQFEEIKFNSKVNKNTHPTVKPIKLMQYLVRLVTKKGGLVLDPFAGSGTTGIACIKEGTNFVLIEKEENYFNIINNRIKYYQSQSKL